MHFMLSYAWNYSRHVTKAAMPTVKVVENEEMHEQDDYMNDYDHMMNDHYDYMTTEYYEDHLDEYSPPTER